MVGPRHTLVLAHAVMASCGAGVSEGVTVGERVPEAVRLGLVLGVAVRVCVGEGEGDCEGVPVADGVTVREALRVGVPERVRVAEGLAVREVLGVPLPERVAVTEGVAESEEPGEGVCDCVAVAEHVGAAPRPGLVQPGQGQGVGAPEPAGQKLPMVHSAACALALPSAQKYPALHGPLQLAVPKPVVLPYVPAGHGVKLAACAVQ